jgi:type IV pilus assembly protein PilA
LVVVVPVFLSLAIYGLRKYIANAKTAEARNSIAQIAKDAAAAYEGGAATTHGAHALCASASRPVPESIRYVSGAKYQSAPGDWSVDAAQNAGFACLRFSMDQPQYYMYSYHASGRSSAGDSFQARANGDLNGDGVLSTFTLKGHVEPNGAIAVDPNLVETNPQE